MYWIVTLQHLKLVEMVINFQQKCPFVSNNVFFEFFEFIKKVSKKRWQNRFSEKWFFGKNRHSIKKITRLLSTRKPRLRIFMLTLGLWLRKTVNYERVFHCILITNRRIPIIFQWTRVKYISIYLSISR